MGNTFASHILVDVANVSTFTHVFYSIPGKLLCRTAKPNTHAAMYRMLLNRESIVEHGPIGLDLVLFEVSCAITQNKHLF